MKPSTLWQIGGSTFPDAPTTQVPTKLLVVVHAGPEKSDAGTDSEK
jgi:hypothetical protein